MAKTTYPYVIAWHANPGRVDLWTKKGAWGSDFRFDIMKLFRTISAAQREAFSIVVSQSAILGEVSIYRLDRFVRDVARPGSWLEQHGGRALKLGRFWMKHRRPQKYFVEPRDPIDHGHGSTVSLDRTGRGGNVYKCSWCGMKVGTRRVKLRDAL